MPSCGVEKTDKYAVTFQIALFYIQVEFNISQRLVSLEAIHSGPGKKKTAKNLLDFCQQRDIFGLLEKETGFKWLETDVPFH